MHSDRTHRTSSSHRLQAGALMIEVVMALAIAAGAALAFVQLSEEQLQRARTTMAARQAATLAQAMQSFINDRYADLLTRATATTPALITVADLVTANYLPAGTVGRDDYGHTLCTLVIQVPGAPMSRLQGLMVAESDDAPPLGDVDLGRIVSGLGGAGGGVYSEVGAAPGDAVRGASGAWEVSTTGPFSAANDRGQRCDGSAGSVALARGRYMVALWHGKVFNNEDVLYRREIAGRADLNTMTTPLGLFVDAAGVRNVAFGQTCGQARQLATDASGQMLNCKADSTGALSWTNTYASGVTGVGLGGSCTMPGAYALDAAGVPLVCRGGVWGNFYAAGSGVKVGSSCPAAMNGAFAIDASGVPLACRGGTWNSSIPTDDGSMGIGPGGACSPNGSIVLSSSGRPYICTNGHWRDTSDPGEIGAADFTSPGGYDFTVPDNVYELTVTLAGGGEGGGRAHARVSFEPAELFSGGSGGFVIDRPVRVTPGQRLRIQVGGGGDPVNWGLATRGGDTFLRNSDGPSVDVSCSGGGGHPSGRPGWAGTCNVQPHGGVPGPVAIGPGGVDSGPTYGHVRGGQTPFRYGSGGMSGRCWDVLDHASNCQNMDSGLKWADYGNNVNPAGRYWHGINGAVFLRWRQ